MSLINVDQEKCNQDGLCVGECPVKIIAMGEDVPQIVAGGDAICIRCGHCVAVCPTGALSHRDMAPGDCPPVRGEWKLSPDQAEHFLRSRRSVRRYKKETVPRETLERLVNIASYAPSGHNSQPVFWTVIEKPEDVRNLAGLTVDWMNWMVKNHPDVARAMHMDLVAAAWEAGADLVNRGAPHLIIAHGVKDFPPAQAAAILALGYLELAAPPLGLGTCWAGYFTAAANTWPPLAKAIGLPENHTVFGAAMAGIPKWGYHRLPLRDTPRVNWK
ncbi:MAG: nitroreductase family protein [Proteobacteria bacterium]|nr:nitroreductase family protein [Pseudomonadota bacterium]